MLNLYEYKTNWKSMCPSIFQGLQYWFENRQVTVIETTNPFIYMLIIMPILLIF